ncbi:hypothetical protein QCE73_37290 [Caballeronia sp. LZ029]|uniref:hypothetical protein n=1 Tax=Caballeronia sp. LZ029 TaxID=3038564 RepID=UPI002858510B|nr:hypothetical protein [Caballeronia sp. LZ029]MDR5748837.1 hypothetical protein [Caballeronia sp. LZ029]
MLNSRTYFGTDGALVISDPTDLDQAVFTKYFGESGLVGHVMGVSLCVQTEIKAAYEIGRRSPSELRAGNISISGSVERAYINGAMLKLMIGQYSDAEEAAGYLIPSFSMKLILDNMAPAGDAGNSIINVFGVMFDTWQANLPEDDFMLERMSFRARRISVADNEVS